MKIEKVPGHYWTSEEKEFLKQNCFGRTMKQLTEMFNKQFNSLLTISQITHTKKRLKLKNGVVTRFAKGKGTSYPRGVGYQHHFTKEELQFLKNNVELPNFLVTEMFNEKFKTSLTVRKIYSAKSRHGINGCTIYGSKYITGFQKGNIPPKIKPLGSERINQGYTSVKVTEHKKENYKAKSRVVWEQHNGEIPKGYNIIFLDGNRQNCDIENLEMVSKSINATLNSSKLRTNDKNLTKTGIVLAKLIQKIKKVEDSKLSN